MPKPGTLGCLRRVKPILLQSPPTDGTPWVADCRSYDIPNTIRAMIRNAAPGMVAVTLSPLGGKSMVKWAEHEARKRGARVLWWTFSGESASRRRARVDLEQSVKGRRRMGRQEMIETCRRAIGRGWKGKVPDVMYVENLYWARRCRQAANFIRRKGTRNDDRG